MLDKQCKALAFLVLFPKTPKGRYGYTTERQVAISPVKYLNARRHSRPMQDHSVRRPSECSWSVYSSTYFWRFLETKHRSAMCTRDVASELFQLSSKTQE